MRESDTVSRFGGEEFIILMPQTSVKGGYVFAERLRERIMENPFTVGSHTVKITASIGVSSARDISGESFEAYYSAADKALYLAKQLGRNRVEVACEGADAPKDAVQENNQQDNAASLPPLDVMNK